MPYISIKTPKEISADKATEIKTMLGKAIGILPGKTERWLMVSFEKQDYIYFAGDNAPSAIIEVSLFGKADSGHYEKMTGEICEIISDKLDIPKDRIYVKYSETQNWGWNGSNF